MGGFSRESLAKGSGVVTCNCCGHPIYKMDSVMLTFTRVNNTDLRIKQFKFRLCYRCADPRIWALQDGLKKPVHKQGVTAEEYIALVGGR